MNVDEQKISLYFEDDFPVAVQLRIQPLGGIYRAYLQIDGGIWQRFDIDLQPHDIQEINSDLQQAIERLAATLINSSYPSGESSDDQHEAIIELAKKGNSTFKRIFNVGAPRDLMKSVLKPGATIQITAEAESFLLPWELLYDGAIVPPDVTSFWGMRYIISRAIVRDILPSDKTSSIIRTVCPGVGLVTYDGLEYVIKQEIPAFRKWQDEQRIHLMILPPLFEKDREDGLRRLDKFLDEGIHILHAACHAVTGKSSSDSYLLISNEFRISVQDFHVYDLVIHNHPFVILNACLTGTRNSLYTSNWASLLWKRGARGVLATELHVPDWFAATFIEELYTHFLAGKPIGQALLSTRNYFGNEHNNLLGLGYALYSSPAVRIVRSEIVHE
jgi:hypothetical protein